MKKQQNSGSAKPIYETPKQITDAVTLLERDYMQVGEAAEQMQVSYMYCRNMIAQDRYGLGTATVNVHDRLLVQKAAVANAIKVRNERKAAKGSKQTDTTEPEEAE